MSACRCSVMLCSPTVRRGPVGRRPWLRYTLKPSRVAASAMSLVPMEPNSFPSVPALAWIVSLNSFIAAARSSAEDRCSRARRSNSARRDSERATLAGVASVALPCGRRKLRPKPERTLTRSPMLPRFATFCRRMTSITCRPLMLVRVRQQRQEARALDRHCQLALVERLGAGDAARDDLARLGHVALERGEILVVDGLHPFGSEAAEFLAPREAAAAAAATAAAAGAAAAPAAAA